MGNLRENIKLTCPSGLIQLMTELRIELRNLCAGMENVPSPSTQQIMVSLVQTLQNAVCGTKCDKL